MLRRNCEVGLELDGDERVYRAGDRISGTVRVEVTGEVECHKLELRCACLLEASGETEVILHHDEVLFEGTWASEQTLAYPFDIELPPGPYTHEGRNLRVFWRLATDIDLSWRLDPSDSIEFVLEPGGAEEYDGGTIQELDVQREPPVDARRVDDVKGAWAVAVLGVGFLILLMGLAESVAIAVFSAVPLGGGAWLMYAAYRSQLAERRLGDVEVEFSSAEVTPGGTVACRVGLEPPEAVELEAVTCRLRGVEQTRSGKSGASGPDRVRSGTSIERETLYEGSDVPEGSQGVRLSGGEAVEFRSELSVPEGTHYSVEIDDNFIRWVVEVEIELASWANWCEEFPILVRPAAEGEDGG
jgi:hypothetical protein